MDQVWFVAALWLLLALVAVLIANWLKISTALSEIVVGTVAQLAIGALAGSQVLGATAPWITFLAGTGAIVLTFLAGADETTAEIPCDRNSVHVRARNPAENRGGVEIQHDDFPVVGNVQPAAFCIRCQVIPAVIAGDGNRLDQMIWICGAQNAGERDQKRFETPSAGFSHSPSSLLRGPCGASRVDRDNALCVR